MIDSLHRVQISMLGPAKTEAAIAMAKASPENNRQPKETAYTHLYRLRNLYGPLDSATLEKSGGSREQLIREAFIHSISPVSLISHSRIMYIFGGITM